MHNTVVINVYHLFCITNRIRLSVDACFKSPWPHDQLGGDTLRPCVLITKYDILIPM